jgi:hypothetical protein
MQILQHHMPMFDSTRDTGWLIMAFAAVAQVASNVFVNAVLFQGSVAELLRDIHATTGGLIEPNLVANLVPLLLVVGLVIFAVGRLKPEDVGWVSAKLVPALLITLGLWVGAQMVLAVIAASGEGRIALHQAWVRPGAGFVLGGVLGQVFGNALTEETVFRGFFFPQLYKKFGKRLGRASAVVVAALVSQVGFALLHIPNRLLVKGVVGPELIADQVRLVVAGLIFLAIYVVTKNLFVAVGLHAIANDPAPLIQASDGVVAAAWLSLVLLLVLLWKPVQKLVRRRTAEVGGSARRESA